MEGVTDGLQEVEIEVEGGESSEEEEEKEVLEEVKEETEDVETKLSEDDDRSNVGDTPEKEIETDGPEDKAPNKDESGQREASKKEPEIEFPDTDVKVGFDRLGSVEIRTKTVSVSEDSPVDATKKVKKQRMQRMEKSQKGQQNEEAKAKTSNRSAPAWKVPADSDTTSTTPTFTTPALSTALLLGGGGG